VGAGFPRRRSGEGPSAAAGDEHRWEQRLPPMSDQAAHATGEEKTGALRLPLTRRLDSQSESDLVGGAGTMHYEVAFGA
jgi:hypothetical protein